MSHIAITMMSAVTGRYGLYPFANYYHYITHLILVLLSLGALHASGPCGVSTLLILSFYLSFPFGFLSSWQRIFFSLVCRGFTLRCVNKYCLPLEVHLQEAVDLDLKHMFRRLLEKYRYFYSWTVEEHGTALRTQCYARVAFYFGLSTWGERPVFKQNT